MLLIDSKSVLLSSSLYGCVSIPELEQKVYWSIIEACAFNIEMITHRLAVGDTTGKELLFICMYIH